MELVLSKAIAFIAIIAMGYTLKRVGFFKASDFYFISKIVIRITLPAVIVSNFSKLSMEPSLLIMCLVGIFCNLVMIAVGYVVNSRKTNRDKAFYMINLSGYNIGNFTMPFVQSFLGPVGFAATSLFDAGNAVMCTGVTYSLASAVIGEGEKKSLGSVIKKLFSSFPFDAYVIMTVLALLHLQLPQPVIIFADTVGAANAYLALLMIGIGFDVKLDLETVGKFAKILFLRYGIALLFSLGFFFLTPFSLELRQTLAIIVFGPISSVATAYTGQLDMDVAWSSAINSLSIIMSIITITIALIIVL